MKNISVELSKDGIGKLNTYILSIENAIQSQEFVEFIADKAEVNHDSSSINFPSYPKEYLEKRDSAGISYDDIEFDDVIENIYK